MIYHVYSPLLEGYIAMDFQSRQEALYWIDEYYKARPPIVRQKERLMVVPVPKKG